MKRFSFIKFVKDCISLKDSISVIEECSKSWAFACTGMTKEEMNHIDYETDNKWMVEINE